MTCELWDEIMDSEREVSGTEMVSAIRHANDCLRCRAKVLVNVMLIPPEMRRQAQEDGEIYERKIAKLAGDAELMP
jgi:hypothetical protein